MKLTVGRSYLVYFWTYEAVFSASQVSFSQTTQTTTCTVTATDEGAAQESSLSIEESLPTPASATSLEPYVGSIKSTPPVTSSTATTRPVSTPGVGGGGVATAGGGAQSIASGRYVWTWYPMTMFLAVGVFSLWMIYVL
jgi:hypothetical protein